MQTSTHERPNFIWPPINGSVVRPDNTPTRALYLGNFTPAPATHERSAFPGGVSRAELLRQIVAERQGTADTGMSMAELGEANGRSGDTYNYEGLRGPEPRGFAPRPAPSRVVVGLGDVSVYRHRPNQDPGLTHRGAQSVPAGRARSGGSSLGASFTHKSTAAPVSGFGAERARILDSAFGVRLEKGGGVMGTTPSQSAEAQPTETTQPTITHRTEIGVGRHRRPQSKIGRGVRLLLDRMIHRSIGGRGRHSALGRNVLIG